MAHAHGKAFVALVDRARENVHEMSIEEYRRRVAAGERFVLVDVREDLEWAEGHIPGAIHIGKGVLERDIEQQLPDPEVPIVFQCRGGYRSVLAADSVARMGYTRTWSLAEGYRGWVERGLPVEKE
jgi:rhodanese-related sulfurtransferase